MIELRILAELDAKFPSITGRVAILKRGDGEIRMLQPDQDAALRWMKENLKKDDEFVAIVWLDVLLAVHTRPWMPSREVFP